MGNIVCKLNKVITLFLYDLYRLLPLPGILPMLLHQKWS